MLGAGTGGMGGGGLVRGRVPRWLAVFQLSVLAWQARALAYSPRPTDRFPAAGRDHPARIQCAEAGVARWKVLVWQLLTSLPHLLVLALLTVALVPAALLGWIAIALVGRLPRALQAHGHRRRGLRRPYRGLPAVADRRLPAVLAALRP